MSAFHHVATLAAVGAAQGAAKPTIWFRRAKLSLGSRPIADIRFEWQHDRMRVRVTRRPAGEAPEWVRDSWIGISLPLASNRERTWRGIGVLTGPHHWLSQLWAVLRGRTIRMAGYAVNAKVAVDLLAELNPEAADWWREHTPQMLTGRRYFVFDTPACTPEPGLEH